MFNTCNLRKKYPFPPAVSERQFPFPYKKKTHTAQTRTKWRPRAWSVQCSHISFTDRYQWRSRFIRGLCSAWCIPWIWCSVEWKSLGKCCFRPVTSPRARRASKRSAKCLSNHAGAYAVVVFLFYLGLLECATPSWWPFIWVYPLRRRIRVYVIRLRKWTAAAIRTILYLNKNIKQYASYTSYRAVYLIFGISHKFRYPPSFFSSSQIHARMISCDRNAAAWKIIFSRIS